MAAERSRAPLSSSAGDGTERRFSASLACGEVRVVASVSCRRPTGRRETAAEEEEKRGPLPSGGRVSRDSVPRRLASRERGSPPRALSWTAPEGAGNAAPRNLPRRFLTA